MTVVLEARDLNFSYGTVNPVLQGWTHQFHAGEVVALTGPSGRGKSTLLYLLGLMLSPTGGDIAINGQGVSRLPDRQRAQLRAHSFGFVFQDAALDPSRSVEENIIETALYRGAKLGPSRHKAAELMRNLGVDLRSDHRPGAISGGQAQRVAMCRALLNDPAIILADEPTGNLDRVSSAAVISALHAAAAHGATVVVASHDPRLIDTCDRQVSL